MKTHPFLRNESGQDLIEYTLLMAFVALAAAVIFVSSAGPIRAIWDGNNSAFWTVTDHPKDALDGHPLLARAELGACSAWFENDGEIRLLSRGTTKEMPHGIAHAITLVPNGSVMRVADEHWNPNVNEAKPGFDNRHGPDFIWQNCGSKFITLPPELRERFHGWREIPAN